MAIIAEFVELQTELPIVPIDAIQVVPDEYGSNVLPVSVEVASYYSGSADNQLVLASVATEQAYSPIASTVSSMLVVETQLNDYITPQPGDTLVETGAANQLASGPVYSLEVQPIITQRSAAVFTGLLGGQTVITQSSRRESWI